MAEANKEIEIFKKYLVGRKILIVDPSSSARNGIFKVFAEIGVKTSQLILASSYQDALTEIQSKKPDVVLSEYELGKSCGLELLQSQRNQNPDAKKSLFILITGNTSQSAVARAAEEDIDGYLLKPFTANTLRKAILTMAMTKLSPPPYVVTIEEGKELIFAGKLEEAEKKFQIALTMDSRPALAHYYLGQLKFMKQILLESKGSYRAGLDFNKIHYKCLVGLYELLMGMKNHAEAYEAVKKVSQYFPANPKRLGEVLRLAIMNGKYEDVEKYYAVFCNIEDRSEILIKYICAALVVCGKYYLQNGNRSRAFELFQKAGATSAGRTQILREIVTVLVQFKLAKEAGEFLQRYPAETQSAAEFLLLRFEVNNIAGFPSSTISSGRELLQKGIHSERLYEILIVRYLEGKQTSAAENLAYEAGDNYPDKKQHFMNLVQVEKAA